MFAREYSESNVSAVFFIYKKQSKINLENAQKQHFLFVGSVNCNIDFYMIKYNVEEIFYKT